MLKASKATLDVKTDLTVKNASFAAIKTTKLTADKNLTIAAGANDIATVADASYEFGNNSTLIYSVDTSTADKKIDLKAALKNKGAGDADFNLIFRTTSANTLNINGVAGVTIGTDGTHRVKELKLGGAANFVFDNNIDIFAKTITVNTTGEVTFNKAIDSGANSELHFTQAGKIKFAVAGANKITKIDFKNYNGTITFANRAEFEGSIDSTGGGAGNLIFKGASKIIGKIGEGNPLNLIQLQGNNATNVSFENQIQAKKLEFTNDGKLQLNDEAKIESVDFKNNDGTITFANGAEFEGSIDSTGGGAGNLIFKGASKIIGQIGGGNPLNLIQLQGNNATNVIFKNQIQAKKLEFTNDGKLQLDDDAVIDELAIANPAARVHVSDGKTLEFTGSKNVSFNGSTIVFDGNDSGMKFNSTAGNAVTVDIINNNFNAGNNARLV